MKKAQGKVLIVILLIIIAVALVVIVYTLINKPTTPSNQHYCDIGKEKLRGAGCTQDSDCYYSNERCSRVSWTCVLAGSDYSAGEAKIPTTESECEKVGGIWI